MKELIEKLPTNWDQITLDQYQKLQEIVISEDDELFDGVNNTLSVCSILSGVSVDELSNRPLNEIMEIGNRLEFLLSSPDPKKTDKFKWKKLNEITYDNYISYLSYHQEIYKNFHKFIKDFNKSDLTDEEILQLPITEVLGGFFLYIRQLRKFLNRLTIRTRIQILISRMKIMVVRIFKRIIWKKKNKSNKHSDGIS